MSLFEKLFGAKRGNLETQKEDVQSSNVKKRLSLAKDSKTNKEILYYLAEMDPDPKVRRAVAENQSMPLQVTPVLAADPDQDVRLALAGRLVKLLPDLSEDKHSQLYAFAVQALGMLALDEVLKIRVALSSTLKDHAYTPPKIAGQLARDIEREVSEPILRFCAALADEDLLDILKDHPEGWVVQAVAQRETVSEDVSEAVIETEDVPAGALLIQNEGAQITQSLLHHIIEKAQDYPEWQKPMVMRKSLPPSIVKELAGVVEASVRDILLQRDDFDAQTAEEVAEIFRRRMDFGANKDESDADLVKRIQKTLDEGRLNEETVSDALAMRDYQFVMGSIAHFAKTDLPTVRKVFEMKAPKPIVALCWKAKLSMRLAFLLQKDLAKVPHKELIYPKDGTDYPLTQDEIDFQLDFLGLKAA